jgi:hypothetical protein
MLRMVLAGLACLAAPLVAGGCTYGSAVDIAPMSARPSKPVLPPGAYCEVKGDRAPFTVASSQDCVPLAWDGQARAYTVIDPDDGEDIVAAIVPIGSGVHAAQITLEEGPAPHQISLLLAKGEAFAMLPTLDGEEMAEVAARHGKVTFRTDAQDRPYIAAGELRRIRAFLLDAARRSLRDMRAQDETLSVGVRDVDGAPDHAASPAQTRDIEALLKASAKLGR